MQKAKSKEQTNGVSWISLKRNEDSTTNDVAANRSNNPWPVSLTL